MPEGHVIHRLARVYADAFGGLPSRSTSPQGRFADGAAEIDGRVLTLAEAVGKHLLLEFEGRCVHVHLGMAGRSTFYAGPPDDRPLTGVIRWRLENDREWADLRGPAACELLAPQARERLLHRLGPDPLREDSDPEIAWTRVRASRRSVAELLMDQRMFAGVGNIFRAEVLFRLGVDPRLPGRDVPRETFEEIWSDLEELMARACAVGRIDTVRAEHLPEAMGRPPRVDRHGGEVYVYRREGQPCHVCGTAIEARVVAARNLFWCPGCQAP